MKIVKNKSPNRAYLFLEFFKLFSIKGSLLINKMIITDTIIGFLQKAEILKGLHEKALVSPK